MTTSSNATQMEWCRRRTHTSVRKRLGLAMDKILRVTSLRTTSLWLQLQVWVLTHPCRPQDALVHSGHRVRSKRVEAGHPHAWIGAALRRPRGLTAKDLCVLPRVRAKLTTPRLRL